MAFRDLVFDLYGTLVDIHTEETDLVWEKTAFFFGFYGAHYSPSELKAAFSMELARREAKAGQSYECFPDIPFEKVMSSLFAAKEIADTDGLGLQAAQLFRISSLEYIRLYPNVLEALARLRQAGCRLWLLSNAQRAFTAYELRLLGLESFFDGIYISSDYGCRKPDLRFYQALLAEHKLDASQCLMIGNDRFTDIAGAKNAGMATLYMHTALTPVEQKPADPQLHPQNTADVRHFEYEGDDWNDLGAILLNMVKTHR